MRKLVVSLGAQTGSSRSRPTLAHLPRACEASAQFPCRDAFVEIMRKTGKFSHISCTPVTGGIAYIYIGTVV